MSKLFFYSILLFGILGCNSSHKHSEYVSLPGYWKLDNAITFVLPEKDSLGAYNIFFDIRNTQEYPFSNLFLITQIEFPNGKNVVDTLEYQMTRPDGSWLGSGSHIIQNKLWFKENIKFNEAGHYQITLKQAMRSNASMSGVSKLKGISDVGIIIEKSKSIP